MSEKLKETANKLKKKILALTPNRANVDIIRALTQELIDTLIKINSGESFSAKDKLLHTLENEIYWAQTSNDKVSLIENFEKAQEMVNIDFWQFKVDEG